ncbi:MAG: hypothetical protein ACFE7E_04000 [Candidatus Hodarchaeota archaeon]
MNCKLLRIETLLALPHVKTISLIVKHAIDELFAAKRYTLPTSKTAFRLGILITPFHSFVLLMKLKRA